MRTRTVRAIAVGGLLAGLGMGLMGCAQLNPTDSGWPYNLYSQGAGWGPPPAAPALRVQDCWVLDNSSPRHFVCPDGKVYTSFQIAKASGDTTVGPNK